MDSRLARRAVVAALVLVVGLSMSDGVAGAARGATAAKVQVGLLPQPRVVTLSALPQVRSALQSAPVGGASWEGANQPVSGGSWPAQPDVAVGANQVVEVTNDIVSVYSKRSQALLDQTSFGALCGSAQTAFHDPTILYDPLWKRWLMAAVSYPGPDGAQQLCFVASFGGSATGGYEIYGADDLVTFGTPLTLTQPRLGMTQDAIVITANASDPSTGTPLGGFVFFMPKTTAYLFHFGDFGWQETGLPANMTPPNVLDGNPAGYAVAPKDSTHVAIVKMTGLDAPAYTEMTESDITVPAYTAPPSAPQPGGGAGTNLETGDGLGVLATQYGNGLWTAQTVADGKQSAIRWYDFNTATMTVDLMGTVHTKAHSYDFNPAIIARTDGTAYMSWSMTNPSANILPSIMVARFEPTDLAFGAPRIMWISPGILTVNPSITTPGEQAWGYSGIAADPRLAKIYAANEYALAGTTGWGTRIVHFK